MTEYRDGEQVRLTHPDLEEPIFPVTVRVFDDSGPYFVLPHFIAGYAERAWLEKGYEIERVVQVPTLPLARVKRTVDGEVQHWVRMHSKVDTAASWVWMYWRTGEWTSSKTVEAWLRDGSAVVVSEGVDLDAEEER